MRGGVLREGRLGEGGSVRDGGDGRPTAVSHQPSVNCSQPVAASHGYRGRQSAIGAVQGPKIPSIRRSSQFVWPYPCRPPSLPGRLGPSCSGGTCKSVAESSLFPPPSGSDYAFSSLFSIFSLLALLCSAVTLCLRRVQFSWLVTLAPLRLVIQDWQCLKAVIQAAAPTLPHVLHLFSSRNLRKMVCFQFKHAVLPLSSGSLFQLHPCLDSLFTSQATHPFCTASSHI